MKLKLAAVGLILLAALGLSLQSAAAGTLASAVISPYPTVYVTGGATVVLYVSAVYRPTYYDWNQTRYWTITLMKYSEYGADRALYNKSGSFEVTDIYRDYELSASFRVVVNHTMRVYGLIQVIEPETMNVLTLSTDKVLLIVYGEEAPAFPALPTVVVVAIAFALVAAVDAKRKKARA